MKTVLLTLLITSSCFAQNYETSTKIDMHGGKQNKLYDNKKGGFSSMGLGMNMFIEKKEPQKKKEKEKKSKQ